MSTVAPRHTGDAGDIPGTAGVTYGPATTTSTSAAAGRTVDLKDVFARLDQPWQPKVVARLNDYDIKCARLEGAFVWHDHPDTDELFIVMNGPLTIHLHTSDIALGPRGTPDAATTVSACSRTGSWVPPITITSRPVTSGVEAARASRSTDSPPARKYSGPAAAAAVTTATTSDTPRRNHSARTTNVRLGTGTHASSPSRPRKAAAATPPEVSDRPQLAVDLARAGRTRSRQMGLQPCA